MIVQSGLRATLEATWGTTGLFARADIYDNTSGTPSPIQQIAMSELVPGTYIASFIPQASISYIIVKRVFTDNTYTVTDQNYSASSEAFQCIDFSSIGGSGEQQPAIVGIVDSSQVIVGIVED